MRFRIDRPCAVTVCGRTTDTHALHNIHKRQNPHANPHFKHKIRKSAHTPNNKAKTRARPLKNKRKLRLHQKRTSASRAHEIRTFPTIHQAIAKFTGLRLRLPRCPVLRLVGAASGSTLCQISPASPGGFQIIGCGQAHLLMKPDPCCSPLFRVRAATLAATLAAVVAVFTDKSAGILSLGALVPGLFYGKIDDTSLLARDSVVEFFVPEIIQVYCTLACLRGTLKRVWLRFLERHVSRLCLLVPLLVCEHGG